MPTIHINVKNRVATANGDSRIINGNSDYISRHSDRSAQGWV